MSLATRCTACKTVFRVVQDQLKVSEGWVRCGRCNEVFNALEGLFDLDRGATPGSGRAVGEAPGDGEAASTDASASPIDDVQAGGSAEAGSLVDRIGAQLFGAQAREERLAARTREASSTASIGVEPVARPAPDMAGADVAARQAGTGDAQSADVAGRGAEARDVEGRDVEGRDLQGRDFEANDFEARALEARDLEARDSEARDFDASDRESQDIEASDSTTREGTLHGAAVAVQADATTADTAQPAAYADPSATGSDDAPAFLQQANSQARWQSVQVRRALVGTSSLLALLLAAQVVHHHRDVIAARSSIAQQALSGWCSVAGCSIDAPRRIDDVAVESSGLAKLPADNAYRLTVALRNRGGASVAMPSIELALTDAGGQLIARRTLAPSDFGHAAAAIAPGSEAALQLQLKSTSAGVAGYTVEAFYP